MAQKVISTLGPPEEPSRMSYAEFLAWADEDTHAEWVDGEVTLFRSRTPGAAGVMGFLAILLHVYAEQLDLGEVLFGLFEMRLSPRESRMPDIVVIATATATA